MAVHIELDAGAASPKELEALAAFIAVMRGVEVVGTTKTIGEVKVDIVAPTREAIAELAADVTGAIAPTSASAADALLNAEAERVAAMPKPDPVAPPPGVDVDNSGLPWDARIHASTKVKNADGSWRNKRGVDPALITTVTAELRQVMAATGAPAVAAPPPPAEAAPITDPAAAFAAPPPPVAAPAPPVAEAAPAATAPMAEFPRIMKIVTEKQAAGLVTTELVRNIAVQLGLTGVADLAKRPDLIPAFEALLP